MFLYWKDFPASKWKKTLWFTDKSHKTNIVSFLIKNEPKKIWLLLSFLYPKWRLNCRTIFYWFQAWDKAKKTVALFVLYHARFLIKMLPFKILPWYLQYSANDRMLPYFKRKRWYHFEILSAKNHKRGHGRGKNLLHNEIGQLLHSIVLHSIFWRQKLDWNLIQAQFVNLDLISICLLLKSNPSGHFSRLIWNLKWNFTQKNYLNFFFWCTIKIIIHC